MHRRIVSLWMALTTASVLAACGGTLHGGTQEDASGLDAGLDGARDGSRDGRLGDATAEDAADRDGDSPDAGPVDARQPDAAQTDGGLPDAEPLCSATAACPGSPPNDYGSDDGMLAIDPCAFPIEDTNTWATKNDLLDDLAQSVPEVDIDRVLAHLNRSGSPVTVSRLTSDSSLVPGFQWGISWNSGDENVAYWIPQGLTGSPDADPTGLVSGRRLVIVTWYYDASKDPNSTGEKGIRISLADVTDPDAPRYRLLLLVDPYDDGVRANFRAINIHAGGAVWFGHWLYVADTANGFRVFDLSRILEVDSSENRIGYDPSSGAYHAFRYRYVVPQVGRYIQRSSCSPRFSYVGLDRSTSPPSLLSGEYSSSSIAGRLFRWALDPTTGRLSEGTFYPMEAWYLGKQQVQGAVARGGIFYLSSSQPPNGHGDLTMTSPGSRLSTSTWIDGPEDLLFETTQNRIWGCGEQVGRRYVFSMDVNALP